MTRLILQCYVIDIYLSNSCIVIQTYLNKNAPSSKMHKATSRIKAGVYGARKHGQRKKRWTSKILLLYFAVRPLFQPFVMFSTHTPSVLCVSVFWLRFLISCCSLEFLRMNYEYGWIMPLSPPLSSLAHTYISPGCGCGTALAPHISPGKIGFVKIHNLPQPISAKYKGKRKKWGVEKNELEL